MLKKYFSGRRLQVRSLLELGELSVSEIFLGLGDSVFPLILAIIATVTK